MLNPMNDMLICTLIYTIKNPNTYHEFEYSLQTNPELCTQISSIKKWMKIIIPILDRNDTIFFDIILKYITGDHIIRKFTYWAIAYDKLNILDIIFSHGYDINSYLQYIFNKSDKQHRLNIYNPQPPRTINRCDTLLYLEKLGANIYNYINEICVIFCNGHNLSGINFCLENGARYVNISEMWIGDVYTTRNDIVSIVSCERKKTKFSIIINDVIIFSGSEDNCSQFKHGERYEMITNWCTYFNNKLT